MPRKYRRASTSRAQVSRVTLMIMLMSMLMGLTPSTASALEESTQVSSPKSLPKGTPTLVLPPDVTDTSPKAYPIEPSKTPPPVKAWTPNQELIEKRTASSRTFSGTKPGQFETRLYSDAVNFEKDGKWVEIDSTLTTIAGGKLKNKANSFGLEIADYSNAATLAKLQLDSTHSVSFGIDQAAKVKGKVAKDAVTYSKVKKSTDVRLTSQRNGLKEDLILSSPDAPTRFVFPLILQGLTASVDANGDLVYSDSKGNEWARTPHGFMFDSNLDPRSGESAVSTGVDYALIPHKDGVALEVSLDRGRQWLTSPERVWPVTVDPQIHAVRTWGDDTYVMRNFTRNNSADPELKVGTYDGGVHIGQSYAHFDTAPLAGKQINSATLYAVEKHSWNCNVGPGSVYRVTQPWSGSAMTTFPGAPIDSNQATGGWHSGACPNRLAHWVVTPQVAQMAAEGQTAGSFSFRAPNEADNNQYKKYLSFEAGNGPYLSVDYSTAGPTGDPIGSVDESTPVAGGIRVAGWVIDPDTAASAQVHIYVGSAGVALDANTSRPDVGLHYPGYGDNHGFNAVISAAPGIHNVCFYGFNIAGTPGNNPLLGGACRTITVPAASAPGVPANATATANPDGSVGVNWGAAPTNPWSPVLLYAVYPYYANNTPSGDGKAVSCNPGPCTSTSFTGLPNASQFFYIFPYIAGQWGTVATTNTVTPKTIPSPPTNAVATAQPDGRVKVSWTLSSSNGGATMGVHVVYVFKVLSNGALEYANKYSTPCATCTEDFFDDLTAGTTYKFYVYATNTVSHSATAAGTNAVQVTAAVPTVPDAPGNPQATLDGENVDVTWTAPAGGPDVASYRVQAHVASNDAAGPQKTCDSPCTSVEFTTGLTAGTPYKFKVYAVNSVGDSDPAETGPVTIPEQEPVPDPTAPFAPVDVQAVGSSSQVVLTWQPAPDQSDGTPGNGGSPVIGHTIALDPPCGSCTGKQVSGEAFSTNLVGLEPGTTYVITVIATNIVGDSSPSLPIQFTSDAEPPAAPTITEIIGGDGVVTVKWVPPTELNGSVIEGYELSLDPPCPECGGLNAGNSSLYSDVTGITNDVQYAVRVAAITVDGVGEWSSSVSVTPHRPTYAGLGDSFSAGQGAPPYDDHESCNRSTLAYGPQFVSPYSGFEEVQFLACSGAEIDDVSTQIDQIQGHPDLITLTAGGNDAKFGEILLSCFLSLPTLSCDEGYGEQPALIDSLYQPLLDLYTKAKDRASAMGADVLVFGYPQLFGTSFANLCEGDGNYSHQERIWIRSMVSRMNDVIQQAGDAADVTVLQLAGRAPDGQEPNDLRPFDGHEICSSQEYVNGLTLIDDKYFHPNETGYDVMTSLLAEAWEDLRP
jgi:lysophospholipase L1-like esterase